MCKKAWFINDFQKRLTRWVGVSGLIVISIILIVQPAYAVTITVDTTDDEINEDGDCSLREAIQAANTDSAIDGCLAGSGEDTINLPAGTYILTISGAQEDDNQTGDLDIKDDLIIIGEGATLSIIDANKIDRVIQIGIGVTVDLQQLTITNGKPADNSDNSGGGIHNSGTLSISKCKLDSNKPGWGGSGGGILNDGWLYIDRSSIESNSIDSQWDGPHGSGAGIYNSEKATIVRSTISNNYIGMGDGNIEERAGGGLLNTGTMTVTMSTISGNSSGDFDCVPESNNDQIKNRNPLQHKDLTNNNPSIYPGDGGGIWNSGIMNISYCTIVENKTGMVCGNEHGGGIYNEGSVNIDSSIIAMNIDYFEELDSDCYGDLNDTGINYIRNPENCNTSGSVYCCADESGLYSLADNGGETLTHGITTMYVDHIPGGSEGCGTEFTTDQRDLPRLVGSGCDLGAFELQDGEIPNVIGLLEFNAHEFSVIPIFIIIVGILVLSTPGVFMFLRIRSMKTTTRIKDNPDTE
jgi:CSLREA domain-containing protein